MDIYGHDDFRKVLAELYQRRKDSIPGYSTRVFARDCGLANPGYLGDVIKGRRKLSEAALERMIPLFDLNAQEADFLRLLVRYGLSRKSREREEAWRQILSRRSRSNFARLNPSLSRYYQDYRYPLLRTAIEACDFRGDYAKLAQFVDPPLPLAIVQKFVRELCEWDLVRQEPDGRYVVTDSFVEPPANLTGVLRTLQQTWIGHGAEAIQRIPSKERHVSTTLLSVSEAAQSKIRQRIDAFREEIFAILKEDSDPTRLLQLSIQYFPRSKHSKGMKS
ncbi:MAG: hypothetical protein RL318_1187 [Fibrobacterota bacterium]|jgi:uncharacterized protein (TIGR02147 family)